MTSKTDKTESSSPDVRLALGYAAARKDLFLEEMMDFLRIPSIGAQPERRKETKAAAEWLVRQMRVAGLNNVRSITTQGNPLVYGDWLTAGSGAPTVLIYGHYDVQPPDPLEEWDTPPFEPSIRDGYVYARGSSDDKGQLYIHVKSVESYLKSVGQLPVNVKFIIEGEEESGGQSLADFVSSNSGLLAADVALISDTHILTKDLPSVVYGLRGMCYVYLDVTGPDHDLHSGSYGGGIDNPLNALCHIIAQLKDKLGRIQIPGFYDSVKLLDDKERKLLAENPVEPRTLLAETNAPEIWGEPEFSLTERLGTRPTLDVNGIIGGYTGEGTKTVLPSSAHAKISMRLVPNQNPNEVFELFKSFVAEITPPSVRTTCTFVHSAPPSVINYETQAMQAAAHAYEAVFGRRPALVREGGSIPVVSLFNEHLGLETILMGFGLPEDRIHSPNERFYLPNFYRGIETAIRFLDIYGGVDDTKRG